MGAPFVSQEHLALAGSRNILHLLEEREIAPAGRNRELPYQELSSHFMLLLEAEPPCAHLTKKGVPACGNSLRDVNNAQTLAYWAFLASMAAWPAARRASGTR